MTSTPENQYVLCLSGHRVLNKRISLFIEGVLQSGSGVRVLAFPRGQWSLQRFESLSEEPQSGRYQLRYRDCQDARLASILCFHWAMLPLAVLIGWLKKVPVVYDEHDHYEINTLERSTSWLRNVLSRHAIRLFHTVLLPYVTLVTCIHLANDLLKNHLSRWQPNVTELHNYPVAAWRSHYPKRDLSARLCFIYMGGVFAEKGVSQAVAAFCSLPESLRIRGDLHIFGSGDDTLIRELGLNSQITLHNSLSPAQLRAFAASHRCCGLVLYHDHPRYRLIGTNSRKLYEYLAIGMPVICTSVGELPEFIRKHNVGLVINSQISQDELCEAMLQMLDPDGCWHSQAENAFRLMQRPEMTWEHEWEKVMSSGVIPGRSNSAGIRNAA